MGRTWSLVKGPTTALRACKDPNHAFCLAAVLDKRLPRPPYNPGVRALVNGKRAAFALYHNTTWTVGFLVGTRADIYRIGMSRVWYSL